MRVGDYVNARAVGGVAPDFAASSYGSRVSGLVVDDYRDARFLYVEHDGNVTICRKSTARVLAGPPRPRSRGTCLAVSGVSWEPVAY